MQNCASQPISLFLEGASHPEELVARAIELELPALAITDKNSLAGGGSRLFST